MTRRKPQLQKCEEALDFIADWAADCKDGDTFYGFADIEQRARAALGAIRQPVVSSYCRRRHDAARAAYGDGR